MTNPKHVSCVGVVFLLGVVSIVYSYSGTQYGHMIAIIAIIISN